MLEVKHHPIQTASNVDFVTIATLGDAIDFGDLTVGRRSISREVHLPLVQLYLDWYDQVMLDNIDYA